MNQCVQNYDIVTEILDVDVVPITIKHEHLPEGSLSYAILKIRIYNLFMKFYRCRHKFKV
jgi:hypothetical protein